MSHVDFKFTRDWGLIKKNSVKHLDRALARSLQDVRKVGKIMANKELKATSNKNGTD